LGNFLDNVVVGSSSFDFGGFSSARTRFTSAAMASSSSDISAATFATEMSQN
jgi:hypothetical protein